MTDTPASGTLPTPRPGTGAVALVESPVQLLNVLEWAHIHPPAIPAARDGRADDDGAAAVREPAALPLTVVVLSPADPTSRGQLRRMAELARDQGAVVRWYEARGGRGGLLRTAVALAPLLVRVRLLVIGDPFSRLVQVLLPLCRARRLTVVDDGTATMEFTEILSRGGRLVRWHRSGRRRSPVDAAFGIFASAARRRLTPGRRRHVELFSAMPATPPPGMALRTNRFAWTRSRFGPPGVLDGTDLIGTSLVETGVVDPGHYLSVVTGLAATYGAKRYFAHRKESQDKLHRLAAETGLEIVRPDLPLELVARRGPTGRRVLSFPSTVVHTLPLVLDGTGVGITVVDIDPAWLTAGAAPRAHTFLSDITDSARDLHNLPPAATPTP
ncbi:hypothetical protein [Actinacidiphila paucisporea]|uniref:Uncharacterized protein n=1 Tax=Actinacidiphila paucisporea TaxID=310782 RepID=A0A1M6U913_9ACTN|nr:hypothetical protein [Actinacidiphila paucisporea]SHK65674.1 hypothetical protein SAMN05216499_101286 [Actinacidiphila paucisporea]